MTRPDPQQMTNDKANDLNAERDAERKRYHQICDEPPPPDLDPCEKAKWNLNKAKIFKQAREDFSKKWYNGDYDSGHQQQMNQIDRRIQNLKDFIAAKCCG